MITTSPLVFGTFWIFIAAGWLEAAYDFGFLLRPLRDKAVISPTDSFIFIGETLTVTCQLTSSAQNITTSDMNFEITRHPGQTVIWHSNDQNFIVLDNRTVRTSIEITEEFSADVTVACMAGTKLLTSTYIHTERPLHNVTNVTGIFYVDDNTFKLTWSMGEAYLDINNIGTQALWNPNSAPNENPNVCDNETMESCIIMTTGQDIIFFRIDVYCKRMLGYSKFFTPSCENNATSIHQIALSEHRKTSQAPNLKVVDINNTCVNVTWDLAGYFSSCNCNTLYQLTATSLDKNAPFQIVKDGVRLVGQQTVQKCSLIPFTKFKLTILIKAEVINPWSDPTVIEMETNEDKPLTGPPMNDTSYHAGECVSNKRDVIVYWIDPSNYTLRGHLTKFEAVVGNTSTPLRKWTNFYKASFHCDSAYDVLVYSETVVGRSVVPSRINIPVKELPMVNNFTVRLEELSVLSEVGKSVTAVVTWDPSDLSGKNITLILHMCTEANTPYTCFDDIKTYTSIVDSGQLVLHSLSSSVSLFGYALRNERGQKRGIEWAKCVYLKNQLPERPSNFNVKNQTQALMISWSYQRCDRLTKIFILRYHLYICPYMVINEACSYVILNSTEQTYLAKNLTGGSKYYVYIQAESPAGRGVLSEPVVGVPDVSDSDFMENYKIIVGLTVSLFILILIGLWFWRKCRHSKKKVKSFATNIQMIWENQCDEKESGIYTGSSPHSSSLKSMVVQPFVPKRPQSPAQQPAETVIAKEEARIMDVLIDAVRDKISYTPSSDRAAEQQTVHATENSTDSQAPAPTITSKEYSASDGTNPYMKVTNIGLCSSSDSNNEVCSQQSAVDEGYYSPDAKSEIPDFSVKAPQTLFQTQLSPTSSVPSPNPHLHICNVTDGLMGYLSALSSHAASSTSSFSDARDTPNSTISGCQIGYITKQDMAVIESKTSEECSRELEALGNENRSLSTEFSPGYVMCAFGGDADFHAASNAISGSVDSQAVDYETSQSANLKDSSQEDQESSVGYKSLGFIENAPRVESEISNGSDMLAELYGTGNNDIFVNNDLVVKEADYVRQTVMSDYSDHSSETVSEYTEKGKLHHLDAVPVQHSFWGGEYQRSDFICIPAEIQIDSIQKVEVIQQDHVENHNNCSDYVSCNYVQGIMGSVPFIEHNTSDENKLLVLASDESSAVSLEPDSPSVGGDDYQRIVFLRKDNSSYNC